MEARTQTRRMNDGNDGDKRRDGAPSPLHRSPQGAARREHAADQASRGVDPADSRQSGRDLKEQPQYSLTSTASTICACGAEIIVRAGPAQTLRIALSSASAVSSRTGAITEVNHATGEATFVDQFEVQP